MRHPRLLLALALPLMSIALAACGDDSVVPAAADTAPAPVEVLRYVTTGGCEVLGPNCPTWSIWDDGTVQVWRTAVGGEPEIAGTIPVSAVTAWQAVAAVIDLAALTDAVGPGTCNSCVDGADIVVTVHRADGEVVLDSTELAFDPGNTVFAALDTLMTTARTVGDLPLEEAG
jgi:hypothetical protein